MTEPFNITARSTVRRIPERGHYNKTEVFSILDEGYVCHVGFCVAEQPYVIPTLYARDGEDLYLHGSAASRMMRTLSQAVPVCVTVTLLDGLVLARSAFHHSINYRSVVVFGRAALVSDDAMKMAAMQLFTDHVVPGRWKEVRPPNKQELKATSVLKVSIDEASAKVRNGPPVDDEGDYELAVWAGIVPLSMQAKPPITDRRNLDNLSTFDIQRLKQRMEPEVMKKPPNSKE